ncbi:hypothetical protein C8P64_0528 [Christiangramia gaetbulicola]|uniref:Uncharacterized protein n=1 Tax=Christiangramia gaetbulicola TaxID=703340 RepID=A0A2T6AL54_9FLAO|nr:hypothetical protein [Christiangramia gaetbulicola]PTX44548.1 hypothetical protein C8P64_0528 [Christiangramia gaetbulicola]
MKNAKKIMLMAAISMGLLATSCSDDNSIEPIDPSDDSGQIPSEDVELNGSVNEDRTLDASETYSLTGILSVEAGATLTIPAGTQIIADTDTDQSDATNVYIVVQKGAQIDIQGSSSAPVVMRSASGEAGTWGGLIIAGNAPTAAGSNATAEVGGIIYGGEDESDDSGSINYLVLSDAGAAINAESQFNGLSLYAVGSETSIQNVALVNGADDGVEFFGGTVSASNLYLENNEDDAVDWTEGWSGSLDNVYVLHTIENFSTAIEADKENGNPMITNFTAVSTTGGVALQFKSVSGATITGLSLSGYDTAVDITDDNRTDLSGIILNGAPVDLNLDYSGDPTVDVSMFDWISNRGQVSVLPSTIEGNLTLDASNEYVISNTVSVEDGGKLTIPAGTQITARSDSETDATNIYIVVQQGGMIEVNGTESNPVVMSSTSGAAGSWGGLVIAGKASTDEGINATAEVGGILYGGTEDEDNSGSINYLILKDAGAAINAESQYNGLSLYAVGSGTTIENIAIMNGADDGVEFFGGTVSVKNIYLENNEDDAVDWTEGWSGTIENTYVSHTIDNFSTAIEADKRDASPKIINFTAVSTTGGTALQFKATSGAVIEGLSLSGYETIIDITDDNRNDLSGITIDGNIVDVAAAYDAEATVDINMFDWAM